LKRLLARIGIGAAVFGVACGFYWEHVEALTAPPRRFRAETVAALSRGKTLAACAAQLRRLDDGEPYVRKFTDGTWVIARSHCTHDPGGEWDSTVMRSSDGPLFSSTHHFCGDEGLHGELDRINARSAAEFVTKVRPSFEAVGPF
jgi:hypothetical protein